MRVAMVATNPVVADPRVLREAKSAAANGHEVTVFAWDREAAHPARERVNGFDIVRIRARGTYGTGSGIVNLIRFLGFWLAAGRQLLRGNYDVIHCHDLDTCPAGYVAARLKRKPFVFDAHEAFSQYSRLRENPAGRLLGWFERFMAGHADGVITVNEMMGRFFSDLRGRPVVVANNYPDVDTVTRLLEVRAREGDGGPHRDADLVVGYIGSLGPGTRIDLIVDAIRRLDARLGAPRVDLYLVGPVIPAWEPHLDGLLAALPPGRATRTGAVAYDEVPGHYRHIDTTVIAEDPGGNNERATSVKLFESMAAGRPVVIRPIGDMAGIVHASKSGLVVNTGDPDDLADVLADLAEDPGKREALGRNGREAVVANYTWEPEATKIEALYRELAHRNA